MLSIPKVTIKSGNLSLAIKRPLTRPQAAPTNIPATIPSNRFPFSKLAAIMLLRPTTDPTERSIPRVITTKVIPTAIMVLIEDCSRISSKLAGW